MERLLTVLDKQFGQRPGVNQSLVQDVGHQCKDLRAWGVLDSVLRMVQTPKDFFAKPERFLSYFISPAPPIGEIRRAADSVSFVLPISEERYPLVTCYLSSVLEALPSYISKPLASARWQDSRVTVTWTDSQTSLFSESEKAEMSLHPELVNSILNNLETSQKELEETKQKLIAREAELEVMRLGQPVPINSERLGASLDSLILTPSEASNESVATALHELYRLGDYFARGQQLVTLLIAQGRETPQVREAMRRVDWPFVCETAPMVIRAAITELQTAQTHLKDLPVDPAAVRKAAKSAAAVLQPSLFRA